jgi:hypothetical protein
MKAVEDCAVNPVQHKSSDRRQTAWFQTEESSGGHWQIGLTMVS